MSTKVEICNRALVQAGTRGTIAALDEPSKEARACSLLMGPTFELGLALAPWDFARSAMTLALLQAAPGTPERLAPVSATWDRVNDPVPPWAYAYAPPSDCVTVRYVLPQANGRILNPARFVKGTIQGTGGGMIPIILTNASQAIGVYTVRVTDPNSWTPVFEEMIVFALAARLSIPLSGDKQLASTNLGAANALVQQARITDGNENFGNQMDILPDWIRARDGSPFPYEPPDPLAYVGLYQLA